MQGRVKVDRRPGINKSYISVQVKDVVMGVQNWSPFNKMKNLSFFFNYLAFFLKKN